MIKITLDQLKEIVQKAGVAPVEVVDEKDADKDFSLDTFLSQIDVSRGTILKPIYKSELETEIASQITGAKTGSLVTALCREFGIERKELEAITKIKDFKTSDLLAKAKELASEKYSKDTEGLRTEMTEMSNSHQSALDTQKVDYEKKLTDAHQKYIDRDIEATLIDSLKDAPLPEKANRLLLAKQLKGHLNEIAHVHYDENTKTISLRNKENHELPLLTSAKTEIKLAEKAKDFLTDIGVWQNDTRSVNPQDAMKDRTKPLPAQQNRNFMPMSKEAIDAAYSDKLASVEIPARTAR